MNDICMRFKPQAMRITCFKDSVGVWIGNLLRWVRIDPGSYCNFSMDLCMGMEGLHDQGSGLSNTIDHNDYYAADPIQIASAEIKPENLYELPLDPIHPLQENLAANDNNSYIGYSCLPWHDEVLDHPPAFVLHDPLWQPDLMTQHQHPMFESLQDSTNVQFEGGIPSALSNFEEHQAALDTQILGREMSCNGNEAAVQVKQVQVHLQPSVEYGTLSAICGSAMNSCGDIGEEILKSADPTDEVIGCVLNSLCPNSHSSPLMNHYYLPPPESTQTLAITLLHNQQNQLYPTCCKESTTNHQLDAKLGQHTVRSNQTLPWNIFPANHLFSSDFNLPSPRLSCSSASSSLDKDSDEKRHQHLLYEKPACDSGEPQSSAARHRRKKISEKIRCLEKLIPLSAKLDTARMLEEASKYVKFMQAQVHVLEYLSSFPSPSNSKESPTSSAGTLNPGLPLTSNAFDNGGGMSSSSIWNVNISSCTNALALRRSSKSLSTQQMLHILVTSRVIQRKLFGEEKCVGTLEECQMLFPSDGLIPNNFSNFCSMDTVGGAD